MFYQELYYECEIKALSQQLSDQQRKEERKQVLKYE